MRSKFAGNPECWSFRLSLALDVSLGRSLHDMATVRSRFLKRAQLGTYMLDMHVTRPNLGWNPHIHLLAFGDAGEQWIPALWESTAQALGFEPSVGPPRRSKTNPAIDYILKPRLGRGENSLRSLLSDAVEGNELAGSWWEEWDAWRAGNPRKRFRASYVRPVATKAVEPRNQHIVNAEDRELAQLALLSAFTGSESKRSQAWATQVSESTIARRRRHFPDGQMSTAERIFFRVSGG